MAFYIEAFDNVTSGMSKGPKIWSYGSDTDSLATVLTSGYFDEIKDRIYKNDLIYVAASDGVEQIKVTSENGETVTTQIFVPSSGGAPSDAAYITKTPSVDLPNEQPLSLLATGILKSTTGTGVVSIATENTDYQVGNPALTSISGLTTAADQMIYTTASNTYATTSLTAAGRAILDDATAGDQRNSLGLGTIATQNSNNVLISGGAITGITDLAILDGGTGASTNTAAINNLVSGAALTTATVDGADLILIQDANDSSNLKSVTAQSVANLAAAGGVTSVSGTADRITSTGGATPVIDIAGTYVGQSSITTLGTIASGVWGSSATLIAPASGGTGVSNTGTITVGGNTAFSGAFTFAGTVTGNTAVTFPTSGTLQTTANASGIVNSGTANQIAYYATSTNAVSGLTGANGSVLVTSNTGVPSMLANPAAAGRHLQSANAAIPSWTTSSYADTYAVSTILYASSANTVAGLATANSAVLVTSSGGVPSLSGTLPFTVPVTTGGTGVTTMTTAYAPVISGTTATGALQVASTGLSTAGFVLTSNGASAVPSFQAAGGGGLISTQVSMTAASFNASAATPVNIVAAQGAATIIIIDSFMITFVVGATAVTTQTATTLIYNHTTATTITQSIPADTVAGTANISFYLRYPIIAAIGNTSPGANLVVNKAVALKGGGTGFTGGTVYVDVTYHVIVAR